MSYTPIPRGTLDWDVPVNDAFTDQDGRITLNRSDIDQNTANIATNTANIATNTADIATNAGNIATNTANIATNTTNIATNTAAIAAVTTTANNAVPKDAQVWNVKDHGATGDGTTDDTTAIQNTINLATAGGVIYFPPGTYRLNGASSLALTVSGTRLLGAATEAAKLVIGPSFSATTAISVTAANCQIENLSVSGESGTTTTNPVSDAIQVTGVRRTKLQNIYFQNINGWAIHVRSTAVSGSTNPLGTMINKVFGNFCAGGIRFLGDTTQGYAMNSNVTDVQFYQGGVTTGGSANLDGIRIEDAWDVLVSNVITWMANGTGSALAIVGNSAASFITNLDALGPTTGPNVRIADGANGNPQNTQIYGGVIQQGSVGLSITGAANQVRVNTVRFINNQTHGITVGGTGVGVYLNQLFFSNDGLGATGSNYDINWSGTSTGFVTDCRFTTAITSIGVAGVQQSINVAAGQNVRVLNADFQGSGAASTNWFTNFPQFVSHFDGSNLEFIGNIDFRLNTARLQLAPNAAGNNVLATNVASADAFDRFRLLGTGEIQIGSGSASREVVLSRSAANTLNLATSDFQIGTAGRTLIVKNGTNAKAGTVTANGTTAVTVNTTAVTANSAIILSYKSGAGNTTAPYVSALTAGTSFQIKSAAGDAAVYNWVIIEQA